MWQKASFPPIFNMKASYRLENIMEEHTYLSEFHRDVDLKTLVSGSWGRKPRCFSPNWSWWNQHDYKCICICIVLLYCISDQYNIYIIFMYYILFCSSLLSSQFHLFCQVPFDRGCARPIVSMGLWRDHLDVHNTFRCMAHFSRLRNRGEQFHRYNAQ